MNTIDWSKAPKGFDFHIQWESGENFFYQDEGHKYTRKGGRYAFKHDVESMGAVVTRRPWSGEGLPPVGTVCEIRNAAAGTDWADATIVFASRNVVVWNWVGEPSINGLCTAYAHAVEIRPVRTPEQIAAEEKESAITEMLSHFPRMDYDLACDLYEARYRKQEAK